MTGSAMKTKLIRIGNSRGIRIPKSFIEQSGLSDQVELTLGDNEIILRSADVNRKNWENSFKKMAEEGDDFLLDQEEAGHPTEWDETDWTW